MGWGKEWPKADNDSAFTMHPSLSRGNYLNKSDWEAGVKEYNNSMPTHDPYTNPDAIIYYECGCGAILDPNTKSFAALNNHASEKGWKIRFTDKGYVPYCVKCGEGVE